MSVLNEAGRVLNANNVKGLKAAWATIKSILQGAGIDPDQDEEETPKDADAKEASLSASDLAVRLQKALKAQGVTASTYAYIRDIFPAYFVYQPDYGSDTVAVAYTLSDTGTITLGSQTPVISRTTYEKLDGTAFEEASNPLNDLEASELTPLVEAELTEASSRRIKLISPGRGSSGFYPAAVLQRDGPKVFKKGLKMYWDHQTAEEEASKPENSLSRLAAVLESDAEWSDDPKQGAGLYAKARVFSGYDSTLSEIAPYIGVSIRAEGKARMGEGPNGSRMPIIEEITNARSVDFVTTPGAGGKVLELFEAARGNVPLQESTPSEGDQVMSDQDQARLQEALTATQNEVARLREAVALQQAQRLVESELAGYTTLPAPTRARLAASLPAQMSLNEAGVLDVAALRETVKQAAETEAQYLAALGVGTVKGMGNSANLSEADVKKLEEEVDALLSEKW